MSDPSSTTSSSSGSSRPRNIDPVLRNALRYTVSAKEYKLLHQYLISRAPRPVQKRTPAPKRYEDVVKSTDEYFAAAIRASARIWIGTFTALKLWEVVQEKVLMRGKPVPPKVKTPLWKSSNVRLASSLSLIMLFHRLLFRFLTRLRTSLLASNAESFRKRNPRISKTLTSRLAPAVGASCAGFWLGLIPAAQLRVTIAIYVMSRALEFSYNGLEEKGWFKSRPWWFGSWMLMPLSCGQLLHAFVYDRDCFPASYGNFILEKSPEYIQKKPPGYEGKVPWPGTYEIVDSLAEISKLRWPYVQSTNLTRLKRYGRR